MARIALLIDDQFEDSEFIYPYHRLKEAGHQVDIIAKHIGSYFGKKDTEAHANRAIGEILAKEYDALYIPGGYAPAKLCEIQEMVSFTQTMTATGKTVCAVCHGPQLLAKAGVLNKRTITGYGSTQEELEDAGAHYTARSVEVDGNLITARDPKSLPKMTSLFLESLES
jgi:protease I